MQATEKIVIGNFIDAEWSPAASGGVLEVVNPATGEVHATVPDSGEEEARRAVDAAVRAFPGWSKTPTAERARLLRAVADRVEADLERYAVAESDDQGKPVALARDVEIPRAVTNLRFFASAVEQFASEAHVTDGGIPGGGTALNYTLRAPRGPVVAISPWNLPLYLFTWKIAPALAVGSTVVGKPSELTPLTAHLFTEACRDAGLPPGVLNVLHGRGAAVGPTLVEHPDVPTVTFTGGTVTGAEIASRAAPKFKKLSLELGGKNPVVVFADADLDRAVPESVRSAFANQGEICLCGSRIFVEESICEEFTKRFVERTKQLRVGDPREDVDLGALVSAAHRDKVASYVDLAREEGGTILCGGGRPDPPNERCAGGYFFEPTVIASLGPECRVLREEIFGPVVTITPFRDEAHAVEMANGTEYGLAAVIWTRDLTRAHRVAGAVDSGVIWINGWLLRDLRTPFGGMKQSGVGREGGLEALRFFTEPKNVCIHLPPPEAT